jgi:hypothetical protein
MCTTPLVSIIIVNWNTKNYLKQCIDSLNSQTYRNFEIILVDNNSKDDSVSFVKQNYPNVTIIQNENNVGYGEGNNIGFRHSNGTIFVLVNPDAILETNWISLLVSVLQSSDKIAAVTGKIFYADSNGNGDKIFSTWSKINTLSGNPVNFHHDEPISKVDYLSGAVMMIKKEIVDKIGFIDTDYFLYFEETDWCARILRLGYDLIYVPNAMAWHVVSPLLNSEKKIFFMERNRIQFVLKNFDIQYIPVFMTIFFAESVYIFCRDLKQKTFIRTKIRLSSFLWNFKNFYKTIATWKNLFL